MNSIQHRIALSIIVAVIIPLLIIIIFHNGQMKRYSEDVATEMLDAAHLISDSINRYANERTNELKVLTSNISELKKIQKPDSNHHNLIHNSLVNLVDLTKNYYFICVEDIEGKIIAHSGQKKDGSPVRDLTEVIDCNPAGSLKYDPVTITDSTHIVTVYHQNKLNIPTENSNNYILPIAVELNDDSRSANFRVFAYVDMDVLNDVMEKGLHALVDMGATDTGIVLVDRVGATITSKGKITISADNDRGMLSKDFFSRLQAKGNNISETKASAGWMFSQVQGYSEDRLINYYRPAQNDDSLQLRWAIVLHQSKAELLSFSNYNYYILTITVGFVFLVTIMVAILAGKFISSPLRSLTNNMNLYRKGVITSDIKEIDRKDEVGQLAKSFSLMREYLVDRSEIMESYFNQYQELKCAQDNSHQILMSSPDAIIVVDDQGMIVATNPAVTQLLGYQEDEMRSQPIEMLIPKRYENHTKLRNKYIQKPSHRPMGISNKLMALHKDGSEIQISIALSPIETYEGKQVLATIRDETSRIRYEAELKKLAAVAENTNNLVIVTDKWGKIEWVNYAFESKTGYLLHEIRGKKPGDVLDGPETDKNAIKKMKEALLKGESISIEVLNYTKNMEPIWLDKNIQPVKGERGLENYISIESDITERRKLEEDLLNANVNLELRVKKRTQQLEEAVAEAGAAAEAKTAFLATMSHEIRTPMNGVIGMVELVERTSLDGKQKKMLSTVKNSSNALLTIIDDILDFSKIEAGKLELSIEEVMLADLADEVIDALSTLAFDKSINIIVDTDPELPLLLADSVRLRQILFNLTGNAIKFTADAGYIEVNINIQKVIDDVMYTKISVSDNGIGIEPKAQIQLFQPFTQADVSTTRKFGGTGLGLSICTRLVELMDGEIELTSIPGEGSTFTVVVPLKIVGKVAQNCFVMNDITVLQIINNKKIRQKLTSSLTKFGATVYNCESAAQCDQFVGSEVKVEHNINIVISDLDSGDAMTDAIFIKESTDKFPDANIIFLRPADDISEYPGGEKITGNPLHVQQIIDLIYKKSIKSDTFLNGVNGIDGVDGVDGVDGLDLEADKALFVGKIILVAEDNEINQEMFKLQLDEIGINALIVDDGEKALNAWSEQNFDLILTDCHMPEMDGFELTHEIRKRENEYGYARIPIIAITANALNRESDNCINAGMDDYLTKPVGLNKLQTTIKKWMFNEGQLSFVDKGNNGLEDIAYEKTPVDVNVIAELIGDDVSMIMHFLDKFITTTPANISEIDNSIQLQKPENVKSFAHKLKSSASAIGAHRLVELCQSLEVMSVDYDEQDARSVLNDLQNEYLACSNFINEYSKRNREC